MVLDHVPQGTGMVVIITAVADPQVLGHRDLHVIDVVPVPDRLENAVGKPKSQDVLNRFLAEVVIDAKNLGFIEEFAQAAIQSAGRIQIMAEGFFHDDAAIAPVAVELGVRQTLGQGLDHTGRHRHVKDAIGLEAPLVLLLRKLVGDGGEGFGLAEVGLHEGEMLAKGFPLLFVGPAAP